jgi:flagellum-specific ATP synthase
MPAVAAPSHLELAGRLRQILATYRGAEDLINIGAYARGTNPEIDLAIELLPKIQKFLRQAPDEKTPFEETIDRMGRILEGGL